MKKFSEFRNKLTAKQAANYSLFFSIILTLIVAALITGFLWANYEAHGIVISILMSIVAFIGFYWFLDYFIFQGYDKHWTEKFENAKQYVMTTFNLTTDTPTKVSYDFEKVLKESSEKTMLVKLLTVPEYNFYLKLIEDEKIELTVTDKSENPIYTDTFTNFVYVKAYFQPID